MFVLISRHTSAQATHGQFTLVSHLNWKAAFFSTVGEDTISSTHISGALARASARSGAPWIRKNDNLQMREFLVTT